MARRKPLQDKLTVGFIEGVIAGIVSSIADLLMVHGLKFGTIRFLDYAGVHIYGFKPVSLGEQLFAEFVQLIFTGLLGILFIYLIDKVKPANILFKGSLFGILTWFVVYVVNILYKIEPLKRITLPSTLENYIASVIFGLVLGLAYQRLSNPAPD